MCVEATISGSVHLYKYACGPLFVVVYERMGNQCVCVVIQLCVFSGVCVCIILISIPVCGFFSPHHQAIF